MTVPTFSTYATCVHTDHFSCHLGSSTTVTFRPFRPFSVFLSLRHYDASARYMPISSMALYDPLVDRPVLSFVDCYFFPTQTSRRGAKLVCLTVCMHVYHVLRRYDTDDMWNAYTGVWLFFSVLLFYLHLFSGFLFFFNCSVWFALSVSDSSSRRDATWEIRS